MSSHALPLGSPTPLPPPSHPKNISGVQMPLSPPPRVLFFDVFGTCVDWRTTVTRTLNEQSHAALNSATASLASRLRLRASDMTPADWGEFAQQWRSSYGEFTRRLAADSNLPWRTVDDHHLESLKALLTRWDLDGLWTDEEVRALSLVWHNLDPWPDAAQGIVLLNQSFWTSTLSNGNLALLRDLKTHANLEFTHIMSAEEFGTYKPADSVYLGAAEKLGLHPRQCVMVAAHLSDLKAAKANGFQVIYVERPQEEDWSQEEVDHARNAGWVDMWVSLGEQNRGFITMAEMLGVQLPTKIPTKLSSSF